MATDEDPVLRVVREIDAHRREGRRELETRLGSLQQRAAGHEDEIAWLRKRLDRLEGRFPRHPGPGRQGPDRGAGDPVARPR